MTHFKFRNTINVEIGQKNLDKQGKILHLSSFNLFFVYAKWCPHHYLRIRTLCSSNCTGSFKKFLPNSINLINQRTDFTLKLYILKKFPFCWSKWCTKIILLSFYDSAAVVFDLVTIFWATEIWIIFLLLLHRTQIPVS
jgi:hypothetical protein